MKDTSINHNEILDIETSYVASNSHPDNTFAFLNITYLHNLIDNVPNNNIDIIEQTLLGKCKKQRNNSPLSLYTGHRWRY